MLPEVLGKAPSRPIGQKPEFTGGAESTLLSFWKERCRHTGCSGADTLGWASAARADALSVQVAVLTGLPWTLP